MNLAGPLSKWKELSTRRKLIVLVGVGALLAAVAIAAAYFLVVQRPEDVSNPEVTFVEEPEPVPVVIESPTDPVLTDWPEYGFDQERTRHYPTDIVEPPFAAPRWHFNAGKLLEFSPIYVDGKLYLIDKHALVREIDAETGKPGWKRKLGELNASSPAYSNGAIFAVSLEPGSLSSLDADTGKVNWTKQLPGRSESSPLVRGNKVYVGCECGILYAFNRDTGDIEWQLQTAGAVKGGVAYSDGNLFFGNYAGQVYSVNAATGDINWQASTLGAGLGRVGRVYATPSVAFGRVYLGAHDRRIYSFDAKTGQIAWSLSTGGEVYAGPAVANTPDSSPTVYIGSLDNYFYAIDARSGQVRWKHFMGGSVIGAASVIGEVVYASALGGNPPTVGLRARDGKPIFNNRYGRYNPAITDGYMLYLTGGNTLMAMEPRKARRERIRAERRHERRVKRAREQGRPVQEVPPAQDDS